MSARVIKMLLGTEEYAVLCLPVPAVMASLSPAERAVVLSALGGKSNATIARERRASVRTIANQLQAAYRKLRISSRAQLAARVFHDE